MNPACKEHIDSYNFEFNCAAFGQESAEHPTHTQSVSATSKFMSWRRQKDCSHLFLMLQNFVHEVNKKPIVQYFGTAALALFFFFYNFSVGTGSLPAQTVNPRNPLWVRGWVRQPCFAANIHPGSEENVAFGSTAQ